MSSCLDIVIPFLKKEEGCKLIAYTDQAGRVTIGWGHTGNIAPGTEWSQEQADSTLLEDVQSVLNQVAKVVRVPLNDNQLSAVVSFTFNLGISNLSRSGFLKMINLHKFDKAADQLLLWNHIGMYVSPGLTARRIAERALFLKDV